MASLGSQGLQMPPPADSARSGARLSGLDMCSYMDAFAHKYLKGKIRFETEVLNVKRVPDASFWRLTVEDKKTGIREVLNFSRIVLCTGGCSNPFIPPSLSPASAKNAGFHGPVLHSSRFSAEVDGIIREIPESPPSEKDAVSIVVVGGGKSAQESVVQMPA
ncbi:hypothetical protein JB92DRAFT_2877960 [Gautieria morchelliformis]|nr:hypothetical protein JB92DRAFT_2877960 [Gautieria morchelliformis]